MKPSERIKKSFNTNPSVPNAEWHMLTCIFDYLDEEDDAFAGKVDSIVIQYFRDGKHIIAKKILDRIEKLEKEAEKPKYACPNCHRVVYELIPEQIGLKESGLWISSIKKCKHCWENNKTQNG